MKFNWGWGITIFIALFIGFIVTLVYKTFTLNADLVRDDYYEQEVLFDDKQKTIVNYQHLDFKVGLDQVSDGIKIEFPKDYKTENGKVQFYRPDDMKLDKYYDLSLNDSGVMMLPYEDFFTGKYEVNISWDKNGKSYLYQSNIMF